MSVSGVYCSTMKTAYFLLALFLFSLSPASARELRGDWVSAGAPVQGPDEEQLKTPYSYFCQVEITDFNSREYRTSEGKDELFPFAIARFELNNANPEWKSSSNPSDWKWVGLRYGDEFPLTTPKRGIFSLANHEVSLRIVHKNDFSGLELELIGSLQLPVDANYHSQRTERVRASLDQKEIRLKVSHSHHKNKGAPESLPYSKSLFMHISCDKK